MCLSIAVHSPDRILATGSHAGFEWVVVKNDMGYRCGYARVPEGHPWYGKSDIDLCDVEVHGGLTFAEPDEPCGKEDVPGWWVGFDCCHCFDLPDPELVTDPRKLAFGRELQSIIAADGRSAVRTQEYAEAQCRSLCDQAARVTAG